MVTKQRTLALCLLLIAHSTAFGMERDKSWKKPLEITGAAAAGTGALWALWHWTHRVTSNDLEGIATQIAGVTNTEAANKLWKETYQSFTLHTNIQNPNWVAAQFDIQIFEALLNHCRKTPGLKTEEDLATWTTHLESFKLQLKQAQAGLIQRVKKLIRLTR